MEEFQGTEEGAWTVVIAFQRRLAAKRLEAESWETEDMSEMVRSDARKEGAKTDDAVLTVIAGEAGT
jgi:hypothetical protein